MALDPSHEPDASLGLTDASQAAIDVTSAEAGGLLGSSAALPHKKRALSEGGGDRDQPDKVEKRNRRLVKNREAAQQFRQRQKQHILDMEAKIKLLDTENSELRTKVELLVSENKIVKDQLLYLRSFIGQAVSVSMDKLPGGAPQPGEEPPK